MTMLRNLLFTATLCILSGASARAGILSLDFDLNTLTARPGQTVTARGTVTNLSAAVVDINGCSLTLPGQFTTDSCNVFLSLTGAPLFLGIGESATVDLFTFTPDLNFTGPYGPQPAGSFTVLGTPETSGYDPDTLNDLVDAPFRVTVVPEPGSFALFALATLPLARALRRRK